MQIIQSLECIEISINAADKTVYFPKEMLINRNITALYLFSSTEDALFKSPFQNENILQLSEYDLGLYLNLYDIDGNLFVKKLSQKLITLGTESFMSVITNNIERKIDWEKSNFEFKGNLGFDTKILLYVLYNETPIDQFSEEINGCLRVELPFTTNFTYQDYQLSKVFPAELGEKKIKKIIPSDHLEGYFDLLTNKGQVKNVPTSILLIKTTKEFWFDNLIIDLEKSYYRNRGNSGTNYITFIW